MTTGRVFIILFCSIICIQARAQQFNYDAAWKKVQQLSEKSNLPASALKEVKKIYAAAKKDRKEAQLIKSVVYIYLLQQDTREENLALAIKDVEKEIPSVSPVAGAILKNLAATLYWQYLQNNRYKLYNRTNTEGFNKDDIATWTIDDLHRKISALYLASIEKEKQKLIAAPLSAYEPIIIKGNSPKLRATLYDMLAHEALEYFTSTERDITRPAYAFEISEADAFLPGQSFAFHHFSTPDSLSLYFKALQLYQELIRFHLTDNDPSALIEVDRERLVFVYQNSTNENKEQLYRKALQQLMDRFGRVPENLQTGYLLAQWFEGKAASYQPFRDTTYRFYRDSAAKILQHIVKDSSVKNEGWTNSYNLLQQLIKPSISFQVENVNVPGKPFRARIEFSKLKQAWLRVVALPVETKTEIYSDNFFQNIFSKVPARAWKQLLPETSDLQVHATEVKIDSLPPGKYVLLVSSTQNFDPLSSVVAGQVFYVSSVSYVNKSNQYFILDRTTGQPLAGASVQLWDDLWDYKTSKNQRLKAHLYRTDSMGSFSIDTLYFKDQYRHNYLLDITYGKDRLFMDGETNVFYYQPEKEGEKEKLHVILFTDRSIYRPGQMVYFKGIFFSSDLTLKNNRVMADHETKVYLRNANNQFIDSLKLISNEYGSITGNFRLPESALKGYYQIETRENKYGGESFRVEEYKRPKFSVAIEKPGINYQVNDTIRVSGTAQAYAGNFVSNAQVSYRVVRRARFPYPWFYSRFWFPPSPPMEIAHGKSLTDEEGKFSFSFPAIPDRKTDTAFHPVFDYEVMVDVTDINGETRTGRQVISAGYRSLMLALELPDRVPVDSLKQLDIRTENMNGVQTPAMVQVIFTRLMPEQRLIRPRYWERPDLFVMTKEEYIRYFPHDEYANETDQSAWQQAGEVLNFTDSSIGKPIQLREKQLHPGFYLVTVSSRDNKGRTVKTEKLVEVFDPSGNTFNRPEYLWAKGSEGPVEPGVSAKVQVGTSADHVRMMHITQMEVDKPVLQVSSFNSEKKTFSYAVKEENRGGFYVTWFFTKDSRFFQFTDFIQVPWTNKDLKIEFETFRDKTEPGNKEEWKVKLTGYKNESVAAEMLVSMYDASLDQFAPHKWEKPAIWTNNNFGQTNWSGGLNFQSVNSYGTAYQDLFRSYNRTLNNFIFGYGAYLNGNGIGNLRGPVYMMLSKPAMVGRELRRQAMEKDQGMVTEAVMAAPPSLQTDTTSSEQESQVIQEDAPVSIRKDFREAAFFYPQLHTDKDGSITFSFTAPEALTKWKLQAFAHTKEMAMGLGQKEMVTQKPLMVQPNLPRFLRQGDRMEIAAKVVNMTDSEMTGQASLELFDAATGQSVDGWFINSFPNQYFTVAARQSELVKFPVQVPFQYNSALQWRIVARSGNTSDGEEDILPVLSNKVLVTETLPLWLPEGGTKTFSFDRLLHYDSSGTMQQNGLVVEYTSNPSWYAVQALPFLTAKKYDCAELLWNSYYAQSIAASIVQSSPRIREVIRKWKNGDTAALVSPLLKNQELKSALLEETPWVMDALSETEQKKNLVLLFDSATMKEKLKASLLALKKLQSPNGGFVWFPGGPDDRFMTQYILTGIGHLKKLGVTINDLKEIIKPALAYLDRKISDDYIQLKKQKVDKSKQQPGYTQLQYLYMRSFFPEHELPASTRTALEYYKVQAGKFWTKQDKFGQGMTALIFYRAGNKEMPSAIMRSLKETAIVNPELGMYWKDNQRGRGWYWWQAPVETQSLLIEVFTEAGKDQSTADALRTWLLRNKQTNRWATTKATADACYAILLRGTNWFSSTPEVKISLGETEFTNTNAEEGTGYFKNSVSGEKVQPSMGNITVSTTGGQKLPAWGAVYWKYFEEMDKVTEASGPLSLHKKLFLSSNTDNGPVLTPIDESSELHPGDRIQVRMELRVDRDMEYVHMKDLRASGLEPVSVLSGYKWQGGLGYYESPGDVSTNFFFSYLPKGTYVFEYTLFVAYSGNFTNGVTSIQSMYAPEFGAHSEGVRLRVE